MTISSRTHWPTDPLPVVGPLRGVRIIDLTTVVMGPSATQLLGDLGADVIKIESKTGDSMRWIGPWRHAGMGPLFLQANRNKRSVVLDLKTVEGKSAAISLADAADVIVSNVRPQALKRLGLDYDSIRERNAQIIYCAAVGYGSGGPETGKAVYDDLMQAASGIAGLFGAVDGAPRYAPFNVCDRVVGLYVANAVTAALYHRAAGGDGQYIEVPMFETMAQFVLADHMGGCAFAPPEGPMGYKRLLSRTRGPYPTRDGHLAIVVYTDRHWSDFTRLIGKPDLIETDARFRSQEARTQNAEVAGQFLADHLRSRSTADWLTLLHKVDIPACPVNSIDDLLNDPHLQAVDFFETRQHPTEGDVTVCRFPIQFGQTPVSIRRLAPNLGEHTHECIGGNPTAATMPES
jgi:crotonobetainyl-CoA:carnitine CoA-transferase CaiB-like acyl-CoA transferase